jgi:hypothetical protein
MAVSGVRISWFSLAIRSSICVGLPDLWQPALEARTS